MAIYFCKVGGNIGDIGEIAYQWGGSNEEYDGKLGTLLQVKKLSSKNKPKGTVVSGAYRPKPLKVKVQYAIAQVGEGTDNDLIRFASRFADPDIAGKISANALDTKGVKIKIRNGAGEHDVSAVAFR